MAAFAEWSRRRLGLGLARALLWILAGSGLPLESTGEVIARWSFNSESPDGDPASGTFQPAPGSGSFQVIGANGSFGRVASGATSDPDSTDNTQLRINGFPGQGVENQTAGFHVQASTAGHRNIRLVWDQYNSNTASRYWRVQYTLDGIAWNDHSTFENTSPSRWLNGNTINFGSVTGASDNPNFGVRFVAEFESSATGSGAEEYQAVNAGSQYGTSGTLWLDMIAIEGDPLNAIDEHPEISAIEDQATPVNTLTAPIAFTVRDGETPLEALDLSYETSDWSKISTVFFSGTGPERTGVIVPAEGATGEVTVTFRVTDGAGQFSEASFLLVIQPGLGDPIARWGFNSPVPDDDPATGSFQPIGAGYELVPVGDVSISLGSLSGAKTSDPAESDNSLLRVAGFPAQGTGNKASGLEFRVNTEGYSNIVVVWDHYNSNTASRFWRIQYSIDGFNFVDHAVFANSTPSTWILENRASFSEIAEANDNPFFAIRMVSEFESSATGAGAEEYRAVNGESSYRGNGTFWMDAVMIAGNPLPFSNRSPTISAIPGQESRAGIPTEPIPFTVSDEESPAENLFVWAYSSAAEVGVDVVFDGSGEERTMVITPLVWSVGETVITVEVMDEGGKVARTSFPFRVIPENTPPVISGISALEWARGELADPIVFTIQDAESNPEVLDLTTWSSNPLLIPGEGIMVERDGSNCVAMISPVSERVGMAVIRLGVSDGEFEAATEFEVSVLPAEIFALWDFNGSMPDEDAGTGSLEPVLGSGALNLLGDVASSFGSSGNAGSNDGAASDNSVWRLGGFAPQGTGNRSSGFELRASTAGRRNIAVLWEQYQSKSASRYWRLQYSTNGIDFQDGQVLSNAAPEAWLSTRVVSLEEAAGVEDNPAFAVRLVSEFESSATGWGEDRYAAVNAASNYSAAGALRLDMLRLAGDVMEGSGEVSTRLTVAVSDGQVQISWPAADGGASLERTTSLSNPVWERVDETATLSEDGYLIGIQPSETAMIFRLAR